MFYNDLEIKMGDQNPDCYNLMPLNLFIVVLFILFVCFSIQSNSKDRSVYIAFAVIIYILLVVETAMSRTYAFLSHIKPADHITCHINDLRMKPPLVNYVI